MCTQVQLSKGEIMKIVNEIPEAGNTGVFTTCMKRKREINEFVNCGAKYAEFVRYSKDVNSDAANYRSAVKTLRAPVRIIVRGKSVYAERLEELPKTETKNDPLVEQIKGIEARLMAARNRMGGENENC